MAELPFRITARATGESYIMVIATVGEREITSERFPMGSGNRRREIAERWAADSRLRNGSELNVADIVEKIEALELEIKDAIDARREGDADDVSERLDDSESNDEREPSTSERLVQLALEHYRIGVDDHDEPLAVRRDGPNVALMFRGSRDALRASLSRLYRKAYRKTPNASALADALTNLQGEALEAQPERTYLRVGKYCDGVVIDLGTADGRAVVVTPKGWRIADKSPVLFRRTALTGALPAPTLGGDLRTFAELLNIPDASWPIVVGWLVATFIPDISHPILMLGGEAGTGKTTFARMLIGLFDPSSAPTRSQPDDIERWIIAANGSWGVAIDNVSHIAEWWSDSLCKAVTDDGWVRRRLYTDGELSVISFRRVVILTSIDAGALRGDLGDRVLLCDLERIPDEQRRSETELAELYENLRAAVLGAILDVLAEVLAVLPTINLPTGPRMFDFARVLAAVDKVMGTNALETYMGQRDRIAEDVVEADPVGKAIVQLIDKVDPWSGTMGELLAAIPQTPVPRDWPTNPRKLSGRLKRVTPALRNLGIEIERDRKPGGKRDRVLTIRKTGGETVPTVPTVPDLFSGDAGPDSSGTVRDEQAQTGGEDRPPGNPNDVVGTPQGDDRDGWDDPAGGVSDDDSDRLEREAIQAVEAEIEGRANDTGINDGGYPT